MIKDHTDFTVEEYYGAKGVDEWSATSWQKEISSIEVSTHYFLLFYWEIVVGLVTMACARFMNMV